MTAENLEFDSDLSDCEDAGIQSVAKLPMKNTPKGSTSSNHRRILWLWAEAVKLHGGQEP
jgi:hypothetical protein